MLVKRREPANSENGPKVGLHEIVGKNTLRKIKQGKLGHSSEDINTKGNGNETRNYTN